MSSCGRHGVLDLVVLWVATKQDHACCEEGRGDTGNQEDGVAVGSLHLGWGGAGAIEALGAALGVEGEGWGEEEDGGEGVRSHCACARGG